MKRSPTMVLLILLLAHLSLSTAKAQVYLWTGNGTGTRTTDPANWSGPAPPHNGAPGSNTADWQINGNLVTLNENARLRSLTLLPANDGVDFFDDGTAPREVLTVNEFIRADGGGVGEALLDVDVRLNGSPVEFDAEDTDLSIIRVNLNNRDLTLTTERLRRMKLSFIEGGYLPQFGGTGMRKQGSGILELPGIYSYNAPLTIADGELLLTTSSDLSNQPDAELIVESGASVVVPNTRNFASHPLNLAGTLELQGSSQ